MNAQILPSWDLAALTERLGWPALLRRLDRIDPDYRG